MYPLPNCSFKIFSWGLNLPVHGEKNYVHFKKMVQVNTNNMFIWDRQYLYPVNDIGLVREFHFKNGE